MIIYKHILEGYGINFNESPNHGKPFDVGFPDTIVIHYTAGSSAESSVRMLNSPRSRASAHLVIGRDGSITQLVPFNIISWHAGKSDYQGRVGFNKYSIGIEIDNAGRLMKSGENYTAWFGRTYKEEDVVQAIHRNESTPSYWHMYTERQITIVHDICINLVDNYRITSILGHEEISPSRKSDPGPAFPLDKMRERILYRNRSDEGQEEALSTQNIGLVTASKLNIRSLPMKGANTVAPPLSKGTIVNILQEKNGWYDVEYKTRGWVKGEYIKN